MLSKIGSQLAYPVILRLLAILEKKYPKFALYQNHFLTILSFLIKVSFSFLIKVNQVLFIISLERVLIIKRKRFTCTYYWLQGAWRFRTFFHTSRKFENPSSFSLRSMLKRSESNSFLNEVFWKRL